MAKHYKLTKIIIAILLFSGFVLHFLRLAFPPEIGYPAGYQYITVTSVVAFNVITFPFIFLFGGRMWRNYMFFMGILTGLVGIVFTAIDKVTFDFNTICFFVTALITIVAAILMVVLGHHRVDWRFAVLAPFVWLIVLGVVIVNNVILAYAGVISGDIPTILSDLALPIFPSLHIGFILLLEIGAYCLISFILGIAFDFKNFKRFRGTRKLSKIKADT